MMTEHIALSYKPKLRRDKRPGLCYNGMIPNTHL